METLGTQVQVVEEKLYQQEQFQEEPKEKLLLLGSQLSEAVLQLKVVHMRLGIRSQVKNKFLKIKLK